MSCHFAVVDSQRLAAWMSQCRPTRRVADYLGLTGPVPFDWVDFLGPAESPSVIILLQAFFSRSVQISVSCSCFFIKLKKMISSRHVHYAHGCNEEHEWAIHWGTLLAVRVIHVSTFGIDYLRTWLQWIMLRLLLEVWILLRYKVGSWTSYCWFVISAILALLSLQHSVCLML